MEKWILSRLHVAVKEADEGWTTYDLSKSTTAIHAFWLYELCDVYLEVIKPFMRNKGSPEQRSCQVCAPPAWIYLPMLANLPWWVTSFIVKQCIPCTLNTFVLLRELLSLLRSFFNYHWGLSTDVILLCFLWPRTPCTRAWSMVCVCCIRLCLLLLRNSTSACQDVLAMLFLRSWSLPIPSL